MHEAPNTTPAASPEVLELLHLDVDRFNRRDWDGLRELISADARLCVADCFAGRLADLLYFAERAAVPWRMAPGQLDGETVVIILRSTMDGWTPCGAIRFAVIGNRIERIADYFKCPWVLQAAGSIVAAA